MREGGRGEREEGGRLEKEVKGRKGARGKGEPEEEGREGSAFRRLMFGNFACTPSSLLRNFSKQRGKFSGSIEMEVDGQKGGFS